MKLPCLCSQQRGGFSNIGMSEKAMIQYDKSFEECPEKEK
jgi:hypothetical protein